MKVTLPIRHPKEVKEAWPGQFVIGRWLDNVILFPMQIFIITTRKKNGLNNAQLNSWGMTVGSGVHPYFIYNDMKSSDTYKLINENKDFVINFPPGSIRDKAFKTTFHYDEDTDEVIKSGLTPVPGLEVNACRVEECVAHYECRMEWVKELPEGQAIVCGKIVAASANEELLTGDMLQKLKVADIMFYLKQPLDYFNHWKMADKTCYGKMSCEVREE